jgi:hypothetical protein
VGRPSRLTTRRDAGATGPRVITGELAGPEPIPLASDGGVDNVFLSLHLGGASNEGRRGFFASMVVGLQWALCTSGGLVIAIVPMLVGFIIVPRAFAHAHSAPA